jgi:hypothetical protein
VGKRQKIINELWDCYQCVANATLNTTASELSYELGYLDGLADAMMAASWAADGKRLKPKNSFSLHRARELRKQARKDLKAQRADKG